MSDLRRFFAEKFEADGGEDAFLFPGLTESSVVFDVGGYVGVWAGRIAEEYGPNLFIFEPVAEYCEELQKLFKYNAKAHIYNYGLASEDDFREMTVHGAASGSLTESRGVAEMCRFRQASDAIPTILHRDAGVEMIDLMAVNIEGGEYDLLPHLVANGTILRIRTLLVQFHPLWPACYDSWKRISAQLCETHDCKWEYPFVWSRYDLR